MTDRDVLNLLREANPVRADHLAQVEFPDSILIPRPRPSGRFALAIAAVTAAVAAALVGIFAFNGPGSPKTGGPPGGVVNPIPPVPIALANASAALGAPVVLPDTQLLKPSDAGQVTKECVPGDQESGCVVDVSFPAQDVTIRYGRYGPPYTDPLSDYEAAIPGASVPRSIVYLGGIPAYLTPKGKESPGSGSTIRFQVGETTVIIFAQDYDGPSVEALAQSIIDRSPPAMVEHGEAALADASTVLGGPVVLPDTSLVGPSDAASTVSTACPAPGKPGAVCQVTVDFPTKSLTIRYMRGVHGEQPPPSSMVRDRYEAVVKHSQIGAQVLDLHGTPALFVPSQSTAPPWIEFFVGDVDVLAQGQLDQPTLQAIAQSILDRSGS